MNRFDTVTIQDPIRILGQPPQPLGSLDTNRFDAFSLQDVHGRENILSILAPLLGVPREEALSVIGASKRGYEEFFWAQWPVLQKPRGTGEYDIYRELTARPGWAMRTPEEILSFLLAVESPTDEEEIDMAVVDLIMGSQSGMLGGTAGRGSILANYVPEVDTGLSRPFFEVRIDVPLRENRNVFRNLVTVSRVLGSFSPQDMFPWPGPRFAFYKAWARFAIRNDNAEAISTLITGPEIETYDVDDFIILSMFLPEDGERYNNIQSLAQEFVEEKIKKKKRAALIRGIVLAVIGLVTGTILVGVALVVASELVKELNAKQLKDLEESFERIAEQFDDFPAFQEKINALADRVGVGTDAGVPGVAELGLAAGLGLGILWLLS